MKKNIKFILPVLSLILIVVDLWWSFQIVGSLNYIRNLDEIDLIQKEVWINFNIIIWLLIINSIFLLILFLRYFRKVFVLKKNKNYGNRL
ncbi:hypothetical protein [Frigoriflavimonas asaccharolytica]|uniref:Disulfide bond formation protein DsbB n=1 Tax=Frigoriflavimonas asaccharolytica TaxID=2735899 RepID=A0A8J8K8Z4_9FLAO|nr:hypothetical protein [Frigoriflavimonas asaccharolytica]NRS92492.1 disulfide bond formation protein DsbB [Frigoriflavimonas asaccharolytica]